MKLFLVALHGVYVCGHDLPPDGEGGVSYFSIACTKHTMKLSCNTLKNFSKTLVSLGYCFNSLSLVTAS